MYTISKSMKNKSFYNFQVATSNLSPLNGKYKYKIHFVNKTDSQKNLTINHSLLEVAEKKPVKMCQLKVIDGQTTLFNLRIIFDFI